MDIIKKTIKRLIGSNDLSSMSAEDIVGDICLNLYKQENSAIRENETFDRLPTVIRDIIFIIDFDTELNMNGILGFLENSTGLFLDDTIETLERINAVEDYEILKRIKGIMIKHQISTQQLRDGVNSGSQYEITSFSHTHGHRCGSIAKEIGNEAEQLYLYQNKRNIFDYLLDYVDLNKAALIGYLRE